MPISKNPLMQVRLKEITARSIIEDTDLKRQVKAIKARFRRLKAIKI